MPEKIVSLSLSFFVRDGFAAHRQTIGEAASAASRVVVSNV
jgi:hypothetical protein